MKENRKEPRGAAAWVDRVRTGEHGIGRQRIRMEEYTEKISMQQ